MRPMTFLFISHFFPYNAMGNFMILKAMLKFPNKFYFPTYHFNSYLVNTYETVQPSFFSFITLSETAKPNFKN